MTMTETSTSEISQKDRLVIFLKDAGTPLGLEIDAELAARNIEGVLATLQSDLGSLNPDERDSFDLRNSGLASLNDLASEGTQFDHGVILWNPRGHVNGAGRPDNHTLSLVRLNKPVTPHSRYTPISEVTFARVPFASTDINFRAELKRAPGTIANATGVIIASTVNL